MTDTCSSMIPRSSSESVPLRMESMAYSSGSSHERTVPCSSLYVLPYRFFSRSNCSSLTKPAESISSTSFHASSVPSVRSCFSASVMRPASRSISARSRITSMRCAMALCCSGKSLLSLFITSSGVTSLPISWSRMLIRNSSFSSWEKTFCPSQVLRYSTNLPPYSAIWRAWLAL